jgi:manganese efflux pump family protein
VAFALLLVAALLGFGMLAIWLRHFPVAIVGAHGVLAAVALVLVLLVAAGVGDSRRTSPLRRPVPR